MRIATSRSASPAACPGKAQIGKGMWAAPDRMADMLDAEDRPSDDRAPTPPGCPSPTAATLHATHYHQVDVLRPPGRAQGRAGRRPLDALLTIPLAAGAQLVGRRRSRDELDNNAQGILGYVVRWIDQGVGCSKVPDIHDVGLMEDRATLRISSQHIANWLLHGVVHASDEVDAALSADGREGRCAECRRSALPARWPDEPDGIAFQAARALVFEGAAQPNGYTEPLLHRFRRRRKHAEPSHLDKWTARSLIAMRRIGAVRIRFPLP
ncbi:MAG: hypothetical protein QM767_01735 [Anaeromyxobacter sp.]